MRGKHSLSLLSRPPRPLATVRAKHVRLILTFRPFNHFASSVFEPGSKQVKKSLDASVPVALYLFAAVVHDDAQVAQDESKNDKRCTERSFAIVYTRVLWESIHSPSFLILRAIRNERN